MYRELRGAWSYRKLSREAFQWALDFVVHGGSSLQAYPEYHRVVLQDGRYRVPQPRHRAAPPAAGRHHRRRCLDAGEVAQRRHARHGGGVLHRAAEAGRLLRLRRARAGVRAHAGHGGLRAQGHHEARHRAGLERRAHAAVQRAGRCHAARAGRLRAGRLARAGAAERAADAAGAAAAVEAADAEDAAGRALPLARGPSPVHLPLCRAAGAPGAGLAAGLAPERAARPTPSASASTTTASSCWPPRSRCWTACTRARCSTTRELLRGRAGQPEQRRAGAAALSRDRARGRAGVQRLPRRAEEHAPAAGLVAACSSRSSASTTPATACSARPSPRCCRRSCRSHGCARR